MIEVEEICDRVGILSRGKLIDCDTPSAFMTRHAEHKVRVERDDNGRYPKAIVQQRMLVTNRGDCFVERVNAVALHERVAQ